MPSVRYYNQTAPFWDFIASMEEQSRSHPFFEGNGNTNNNNNNNNDEHDESSNTDNNNNTDNNQNANPWENGWGFPFGPFPHRGRHGPRHYHHGPPPPPPAPPGASSMPPPPAPFGNPGPPSPPHGEKDHDAEEGPSEPRGPPPPFSDRPEHARGHGPGHHRGGPGARGHCGKRGGGRGGWGGRGRHQGMFGGPMGMGMGGLGEMLQSQLFGDDGTKADEKASGDFEPAVDVFDTPESFVIHASLPGAKKDDVGVHWDAEKSELNIAGVIHRPGDEEFLKTLALDERTVGAFERKVRLGSRANPAQVDVDGITAKMEDGVLRVEVPKLDSGFVEIRKVDIE